MLRLMSEKSEKLEQSILSIYIEAKKINIEKRKNKKNDNSNYKKKSDKFETS